MTVRNDPSDHPRDDPEPSEADYWSGVAAIGCLIAGVLLVMAEHQLKEVRLLWQEALLSLATIFLALVVMGCLVVIIFRSDWYAEPLPRTDPDETPDELRPRLPDSDHRSW